MKDYISDLIGLGDPSAQVTDVIQDDDTKYVFIEKKDRYMICPSCGARMKSKGKRVKEINHPVLQDGFKLILAVTCRKWHCEECNFYDHDHFTFVEDGKRNTTLVPLMVLDKLKDLNVTARKAAAELNVSDTYVIETFMRFVSLPRLPFPDIISIDEVYMNFDESDLYAVIIMDFRSGQIIDILPNRYTSTFEDYFFHIPLAERSNVKTIISDMYKPYLDFSGTYFTEASSIIDSFHVVSRINTKIKQYINQVKRRYKEADKKKLEEKNYHTNSSHKTIKKSRELRLLDNYSWFLLKNNDDIDYTPYWRNTRNGGYWFDPIATEKAFMELDSNFKTIRDLKELYVRFNKNHINDSAGAMEELEQIISQYRASGIAMFRDIAKTLNTNKQAITNSFIYIRDEKYGRKEDMLRRISNGPMEGFNVLPKSLKRNSHGVSNFLYTRNRILWATRKDPSMLAVPKTRKEVHNNTGKKRGPYNKKDN
ncbi:MAG TPA: ISL3 family transposase [Erysipelotrichaceae bacterium]|nr:ISL3 family transposase [Erysipelotrichaceae bacterium]